MQKMKFLKLSLLSQREQRALQMEFAPDKTVLVAGNGFGKSAILKSLYETLGANPHKIDKSWTDARVTPCPRASITRASSGYRRSRWLRFATKACFRRFSA